MGLKKWWEQRKINKAEKRIWKEWVASGREENFQRIAAGMGLIQVYVDHPGPSEMASGSGSKDMKNEGVEIEARSTGDLDNPGKGAEVDGSREEGKQPAVERGIGKESGTGGTK